MPWSRERVRRVSAAQLRGQQPASGPDRGPCCRARRRWQREHGRVRGRPGVV